jgi:ABC-type Na+ efflux pump permease subunit
MRRKKKEKPQEIPQETSQEVPPEPPPLETEPAPEPVEVPPVPVAPIPQEEELPPPPGDIAELTKSYPPLKTRKPGPVAAMKRTGALVMKDVKIIAKHGLVSSIILLVFLTLIFYIGSISMYMLVTSGFGEGGDGGDGPQLGNDESLVAGAGSNQTVVAGTLVTLSSASSTHRADIVYVEWRINNNDDSLRTQEIALFGPTQSYNFAQVGTYQVSLTVVDNDLNFDEDEITITVTPSTSDTTPPQAHISVSPDQTVTFGTTMNFNDTGSFDNVSVVNQTWIFSDVITRTLYGPTVTYTFERTGNQGVSLLVRDASGNANKMDMSIQVNPTTGDYQWPNATMNGLPESVRIGDTVNLNASGSSDNGPISAYTWYIKLNNTMFTRSGAQASFTASGFGLYEITLAVRDNAGNVGTTESKVLSLTATMEEPSEVSWTSTPLGQDLPFNVLAFAYGAALLASVIYIGGLFSKGFAHEIQRGTAKTLFFAPISVTNMVFSKILYPVIIGPLFIFPLILISLSPLKQDTNDIIMIGLVSYFMTVIMLVSAAYGSCMIYAAAKRMVIKPTALARAFMYVSLLATLTVFRGLTYLFDQWFQTESWTNIYYDVAPTVAMFSPFHQGGVLLSSMLTGTTQSMDLFVFIIPIVLIVGGILASRRLYPDLFARE